MAETTAPVLDLRLATEPGIPVYQQLADQIRLLASTGGLPVGTRLPSARSLASNLRINRNTALKAYLLLAREGVVVGRRGGGTVVAGREEMSRRSTTSVPPAISTAVSHLVHLAADLGVPPADLVAYISEQSERRASRSRLRIGFVECNPESLDYFVAKITEDFGVTVVPVLLRELGSVAKAGKLDSLDCAVSTFFHLSDVRRHLLDAGIDLELFAIGVRPHLSVLEGLHGLPKRSTVGVVYYERPGDSFAAERLERMTQGVGHAGVREVTVKPVLLHGPASGELEGLDAIVIRPDNIAPIRDSLPAEVPTIEFVNDLDDASRHFLGEVFEDLAARRNPPSPDQRANVRSISERRTGTRR